MKDGSGLGEGGGELKASHGISFFGPKCEITYWSDNTFYLFFNS